MNPKKITLTITQGLVDAAWLGLFLHIGAYGGATDAHVAGLVQRLGTNGIYTFAVLVVIFYLVQWWVERSAVSGPLTPPLSPRERE